MHKGPPVSESDMDVPEGALEIGFSNPSVPIAPPEMIFELALGRHDELLVASRFGVSVEDYHRLAALKPFQIAVASKRAELEQKGITETVMTAMQASELRNVAFVQAMGPDVPLVQRLEAVKLFAKLGGLEPKEDRAQNPLSALPLVIINRGGSITMQPSATPIDLIDQ